MEASKFTNTLWQGSTRVHLAKSVTMFMIVAVFMLSVSCSAKAQLELEVAFPNLSFENPLDLQDAKDNTNRLFVVEQPGVIRVFANESTVTTTKVFLDIRDRVDYGGEKGLLGLAFHPDFKNSGYFYVDYTAPNPLRTVIARYHVPPQTPDQADKNSQLILLEIPQPYSNHNGGQIVFGPDKMLYIAMGDGGSAGDPQGNAQNRQNLLGDLLRIDVDHPSAGKNYGIPADNPFVGNSQGFREEIYAYGLRNPWRFSFDLQTGRLWVADVGQDRIEEIDIVEKGKNYGWDIMEGSSCYEPASGCDQSGLELPIWEYTHSLGQSITGGFVYRGSNVPELVGACIYADFVSGRIWALRYDGTNRPTNTLLLDTNLPIASFGMDKNNELYICAFDGLIYRFKPTSTSIKTGESPVRTYFLAQNYPNPFNSSTRICCSIREPSLMALRIFDLQGRLIRDFFDQLVQPGEHHLVWDGKDAAGIGQPSGTYFYQMRVGDALSTMRRMILVR